MKIVVFTSDLDGKNGWSRYALDAIHVLVARGHDVHAFVHIRSNNPPCQEYPILGNPGVLIGSGMRRNISGFRAKRALKRLRPDIVHFMTEPCALLLSWLRGQGKTLLTIHGTYAVSLPATAGKTGRLAAQVYRDLDRIVSVSQFTKRYVQNEFPELYVAAGLGQKITVIPNGVDLTRATPVPHAPNNPLRIIGVGAVKERKGYIQAVEALAAFKKRHGIPFLYEIIGPLDEDQRYVALLRAQIAKNELSGNVVLCGKISDTELRQRYANADAFLLLSLHKGIPVEGFGLVFLEANSWGIPVVGPTTGGCPEAISDGRSGYACDPFASDLIADKLCNILIERRISPADCLAWAKAHSIEIMVDALEKEYRS